jgi:aspartate kinase
MICVLKYGGSSLATPELIKGVARQIISRKREGKDVVVVVSAMRDTTDELLKLAHQVAEDPPQRETDMLLTVGERISMSLLSMAINSLGAAAISFTGSQCGIITDGHHTNARIKDVRPFRIEEELGKGKVIVVAGFQGVSEQKEVTTLGRGGSDTTAVALAYVLGAKECEILTDVDGVFTADPQIVPQARRLPWLSYKEMLELASYGGKVLHPRSVELAQRFKIPLAVRSSFSSKLGTVIKEDGRMEEICVRAVACRKGMGVVLIRPSPQGAKGVSHIFRSLSDYGMNIDLIVMREGKEVTLSLQREQLPIAQRVLAELKREGGIEDITSIDGLASVSIIGSGIGESPGIATKLFSVLEAEGISVSFVSSSHLSITSLVKEDAAERATRVIHRAFGLDKAKE